MAQASSTPVKKNPAGSPSLRDLALRVAVTGLVALLVGRASFWIVPQPDGIPWIWPPGGLALGLLISVSRRYWPLILPIILIAFVGAYILAGGTIPGAMTSGFLVCAEAAAAAVLLRQLSPRPPGQLWPLYNFRSFGNFMIFLGVVAVTSILTPTLAAISQGTDFAVTWLRWWVAVVIGCALVVPLVVAWYPGRSLHPSDKVMPGRAAEGALLICVVGLGAWYLFLNHHDLSLTSDLPAYLIYPFLIWAALRFDQRFVTTMLSLVCLTALAGTINGTGEFSDQRTALDLGLPAVQHFFFIIILTTMVLSAALVELKMAWAATAKTEMEYRSLFQNASVGIFHSVPGGGFLRANPALASMLGYDSAEEMAGAITNIASQLNADGLKGENLLDAALMQDGWTQGVNRYRRKDGSLMTGKLSVRKVTNADGSPAYLEGFVEDITERKRAEEALRTNEQLMKLFVENAPAAIAMFDKEMRYLMASRRYREDFDLGDQELTGRHHDEVFPNVPDSRKETHRRCLAGAVEKCEDEAFTRADGRMDYIRWEVRPWYRNETEIGGLISLSEVITERKRAEQALIESEALLNESQAMAKVGGWVYEVASRKVTWTQEAYRIFGVEADHDTNNLQLNANAYVPEDRAVVTQAFDEAVKTGKPYDLELRFVNAQGKHMWVRSRGTPWVEDGQVVRVNGTIMDITELKRAEQALSRSEEQLRLAMEASRDGMWDWRCQANLTNYSPAYVHMLGYTAEDFPGTPQGWLELVHPDDLANVRRIQTETVTKRLENVEIEFRMRTKAEGWKWILSRGKTVSWDPEGNPLRVVGTTVDITERKQVEEALRRANRKLEKQAEANARMQSLLIEQATHDALTGMYNRRFLDDALQRELLRAHRESYPISVLMLDIDHFKVFNDTYGHDAGDQVLVALSSLLHTSIRQSDVACRYGGEEFVVVMPKANGEDAQHRAERLREDFGAARIGPKGLSATISIGVAVYPQHGTNLDELLRAADLALYSAKGAGRNCVRVQVT